MVITFDDDRACDVTVVGAKAANLALADRAGLPVLPGFTIPVAVLRRRPTGEDLDVIRAAWRALSLDGKRRLVVRSSAVGEDGVDSSMAGRFTSVLAVDGWPAFLAAVADVVESARVVSLDGSGAVEHHEMAVLVQPHLDAAAGGVLFGADPVSGRLDRFVVAAVDGGPDQLVSGEATGTHVTLSRRGRVRNVEGAPVDAVERHTYQRLAAMARRAASTFGGPQDIEWAIDGRRALWLLQSRPVTTLAPSPHASERGPAFGPGPVAETFPDPLTTLEQDLWLEPLRAGIVHAVDLTGAVSKRRLAASPVVVAVGGRAAVDLDVLGGGKQRKRPSVWQRLDPRPPARRLRAAWRTGRMRRAMPTLVHDLVTRVDGELAGVPKLSTLSDGALADVLYGSRRLLVALHGQEVLAGLLLQAGGHRGDGAEVAGATGASLALRALAEARRRGEDEACIVASHPEVLALVPPAVRSATLAPFTAALPDDLGGLDTGDGLDQDHPVVLREALRLRTRWVQELSAMAAWELGTRLAAHGVVDGPEDVRHLTLDALVDASATGRRPPLVAFAAAPPLPATFRLDGAGRPVAVTARDATGDGQGAGGGRRAGRVVHTPDAVEPARRDGHDVVLVTPTLAPGLAAVLPHVVALVAETGSVLSHLAILARELGVATVVGVPDAAARFAEGAQVVVDGVSGSIEVVEVREMVEH